MKYFRIPHVELLIGPPILFAVGFLMNAIAVAANGGQMPVEFPGGCAAMKAQDEGVINQVLGATDTIHSCMTHATHLKFLCDWLLLNGTGVMSPGDFLLIAGDTAMTWGFFLWIAWVIRDHYHAQRGF